MPEKTRDHLRRLDHSHYCGFAIVHWTHSIDQRKTGWLNTEFHTLFREALIHAGCLHGLWCPAYCLMPDHIHLVWSGVEISSDQLAATTWLRRRLNGWLKPGGQRLQKQAYDRVLRESDRDRFAFEKLIAYLFANPVRGGFIADRPKGPGGRGEIPFFPVIPKSHGNDLIPKITGICIGEYIIAHSNAKSSGTRECSYPDDQEHPMEASPPLGDNIFQGAT